MSVDMKFTGVREGRSFSAACSAGGSDGKVPVFDETKV